MRQWFLLLLPGCPDGAWTLTGREGEQHVLLHDAFAAEAVPADSEESSVSGGQLYVEFWSSELLGNGNGGLPVHKEGGEH